MAVIDLSFVLVGTTIPLDHGYSLFSTLSRIVPDLHGDRRVGIHPVRGRRSPPGEHRWRYFHAQRGDARNHQGSGNREPNRMAIHEDLGV